MKPSLPHFARHLVVRFAVVTLVLAGSLLPQSHAQNSTFNYQGVLTSAGIAANGAFDLQFRLYDEAEGGTQIGPTVLREEVAVRTGLFTVPLDFGIAAFSGARRYLEIGVRIGSSTGGFSLLTPREPINPTPYAISSVNFTGPLAGDVVGSQGATTVVAIQGRPISSNAPGNGQVLGFNSVTNRYEPVTVAAGGNGAAWDYVTAPAVVLQPNRRYAIDSSVQVALTLPSSLNIGDTIEIQKVGSGGWRLIRGATGQYVYGYEQTPVVVHPDRNWGAVASSADGLRLAAADGTRIYTSTDGGLNWMARENSRGWRLIRSSAYELRWAAVEGNSLYISTDWGLTWTTGTLPDHPIYGLVSSADGQRLTAFGYLPQSPDHFFQEYALSTSTDGGGTWSRRISGQSLVNVVNLFASSSANGLNLVFVTTPFGSVLKSNDGGATWTGHGIDLVPLSYHQSSLSSSSDGLRLIFAASPYVKTSNNGGMTWIDRAIAGEAVASSADGLRLLVAGTAGVFTSTDGGETWVERRKLQKQVAAVASSADGLRLVVAEQSGQIYTSTDGGVTWRYPDPQPAPPDNGPGVPLVCRGGLGQSVVRLIYTGNGKFLPLEKGDMKRYQDGC